LRAAGWSGSVLAVPPSEGGIATMTVTVSQAPCDALHKVDGPDRGEVAERLLDASKGEGEEARRLWRVEPEPRMLDEIGWSPVVRAPSHCAPAQLADARAGERS
jgi:hypothetical protein